MRALGCAAALLLAGASFAALSAESSPQSRTAARRSAPFAGILDEHPAIQYAAREPRDRVAQLARRIADGSVELAYERPSGYLHSVLRALDISPESQLLVFSKTGLQRASTGPRTPRALYFNDAVVVGFIPGARFLEIASHDPEQGVIFYTVDQMIDQDSAATLVAGGGMLREEQQERATRGPIIARPSNCVTCHVSGSTLDVPGMITRSNFINGAGGILPQLGFHIVDHRTPLAERWGGWFVTGNYVAPRYAGVAHMGNVITTMHPTRGDVAATSNEVLLQWMDTAIDSLGYPSHESDIAALMVFDHQMRAINLLTRLNWEARVAAFDREERSAHAGARDAPARADDVERGEVGRLIGELVDYFLFVDEAPPPPQLSPRAGFASQFVAPGPRDSRGRSLRDLDLERRLLRYSCSYMIQSAAFQHLPAPVRAAVYRRIAQVLTGRRSPARYSHVSAADRRAVLEILRETAPGFVAATAR